MEELATILQEAKIHPSRLPPKIAEKIFIKLEKNTPKQLKGQYLPALKDEILNISFNIQDRRKNKLADIIVLISPQTYTDEERNALEKDSEEELLETLIFSLIVLVQDES